MYDERYNEAESDAGEYVKPVKKKRYTIYEEEYEDSII